MLKQTLDALSRLDYPNFECVVIINNTPDPAFWQPIQDHCRALGERFKFINAEKVQGFKAGALRIAMDRTAADAEIIGIIDADYVVEPDWLKDLVPAFADPRVGLVQAPQDHRDGDPLDHALHHERRICRLLRHRHGPAQRGQRHHRARHDVPDPPRRDGHGRRLVERHDLRGHRSRPCDPRARLDSRITPTTATAMACCPTPSRPSRSSATAGPMAASRSSRSTGGASCPARAG